MSPAPQASGHVPGLCAAQPGPNAQPRQRCGRVSGQDTALHTTRCSAYTQQYHSFNHCIIFILDHFFLRFRRHQEVVTGTGWCHSKFRNNNSIVFHRKFTIPLQDVPTKAQVLCWKTFLLKTHICVLRYWK